MLQGSRRRVLWLMLLEPKSAFSELKALFRVGMEAWIHKDPVAMKRTPLVPQIWGTTFFGLACTAPSNLGPKPDLSWNGALMCSVCSEHEAKSLPSPANNTWTTLNVWHVS